MLFKSEFILTIFGYYTWKSNLEDTRFVSKGDQFDSKTIQ